MCVTSMTAMVMPTAVSAPLQIILDVRKSVAFAVAVVVRMIAHLRYCTRLS